LTWYEAPCQGIHKQWILEQRIIDLYTNVVSLIIYSARNVEAVVGSFCIIRYSVFIR